MINGALLKKKVIESGMTVSSFSRKSGMLRETFYNKLKGKSEFTASEIVRLSKVLRLTEKERNEIFFNAEVELNDTSKEDT